ncbi:MAG: IS66 family transposase [Lachnospiraceae bacterium]|nr:IS66 family transposase [Lachnospiraceae bacterium]
MPRSAKDIQLIELKDTISKLNELISTQTRTMDSLNKTIEELGNKQAEVDYLKAKMFGSSSEKLKAPFPGQMNLFAEELPDDRSPEIIEPEIIDVAAHKRGHKPKATYGEMFEHLPRREVVLDSLTDEEKNCPVCGTPMVPIGKEIARTELVFHPAVLERVDYLATTYECPSCKDSLEPQFVKDEGATPLVPHSYVSSGLAAHVMYGKFINALPYYRQEKDFENQFGVKIGRGTMAHWTIYCAENYFSPMIGYFHRQLIKRKYVAGDETPIQVLRETDRRPQSKSYVWLFRSGDDGLNPIIVYQYHATRNGDAAAKFFAGSEPGTYINVDGYAGYNKLKDFKSCCYAHIRRYFLEAIPKGREKDYTDPAVQGFLYCNKLFEYERSYREKGLSYKQIYNRRLKDQKPVVEAFLAWINKQKAPNGSRLARALTYARNQQNYMMTYLEDGHCSISNNLSENSIRPVTVGRRNWLFCDSTDGADASMMVYSLLETARANGLNPQKYLEYLLEARPDESMSDEELENMSPWNPKVQELCVNKS